MPTNKVAFLTNFYYHSDLYLKLSFLTNFHQNLFRKSGAYIGYTHDIHRNNSCALLGLGSWIARFQPFLLTYSTLASLLLPPSL